ncbi:MAG: hypothetical protein RR092_06005 [Oscillospiraceae bacterium]
MRRKMGALLLAFLLLLSAPIPPGTAARAAGSVTFTAVDEYILALSDGTMPVWSGGYLYVPATVFSGKELGSFAVKQTWSSAKKTMVLYTGSRALVFDLKEDIAYDGENNIYVPGAITRGGRTFLPVALVCTFFGLTYTKTEVAYGDLIRIKSPAASLTDAVFLDAAAPQIANRYHAYQKKKSPAAETVTPATPADEAAADVGKRLYLSLLAGENIAELQSILERRAAAVTFYFPVARLENAGELTRRMTAMGQTIGLAVDAADGAEKTLAQLREGNRLLARNTGGKTRLVVLENASVETAEQVTAAGYCILTPRITAAALTTQNGAANLLRRAGAKRGGVTLYLDGPVTAGGLQAFLTAADTAQARLLPINELTV